MFMRIVYDIVKNNKESNFSTLLVASYLFFFSWGLTRIFIFSSKESSIYFLTLLGIYIIAKLISLPKRNIFLEIMLAVTIGLNAFVNIHGIIISVISMLILVILSKLNFLERLKQILFIFIINLLAGSLEFFRTFGYIFATTIKSSNLGLIIEKIRGIIRSINHTDGSDGRIVSQVGYDQKHVALYQFSSIIDKYIKGKFQLFTNIGVFGVYPWLFLALLVSSFKKILKKNSLNRVLLSFVGLYFLVVIDPFSLNKHPFAIVLWGSTKYANLILLVGMLIVAAYFSEIVKWLNEKISSIRYIKIYFIGLVLGLVSLKKYIVSFLLKLLLSTIPIFKSIDFYKNKMTVLVSIVTVGFILFTGYLVIKKYNKKIAINGLFVIVMVFLIIVPFFMTDVGKISFLKTFKYLNVTDKQKFENIVNYSDEFKVYYYVRDHLACNTTIETAFDELSLYDNCFKFTKRNEVAKFSIVKGGCGMGSKLFESGDIKFCSR